MSYQKRAVGYGFSSAPELSVFLGGVNPGQLQFFSGQFSELFKAVEIGKGSKGVDKGIAICSVRTQLCIFDV